MNKWDVLIEPEGINDGVNQGGIVVYAVNQNNVKQEVGRIAFVRRNSKNPDVKFKTMAKRMIRDAEKAVELLNGHLQRAGEGLQ